MYLGGAIKFSTRFLRDGPRNYLVAGSGKITRVVKFLVCNGFSSIFEFSNLMICCTES